MFCNIFFHKNTVGECETPSLLQKEKRGYAKSDVSKRLFPDMGKITNTCLMVDHATAQMEVDRKCSTILVHPLKCACVQRSRRGELISRGELIMYYRTKFKELCITSKWLDYFSGWQNSKRQLHRLTKVTVYV